MSHDPITALHDECFSDAPSPAPRSTNINATGKAHTSLAVLAALAGAGGAAAPALGGVSARLKSAGVESMIMGPRGPQFLLRDGVTAEQFRRNMRRLQRGRSRDADLVVGRVPVPELRGDPAKVAARKARKAKKQAREKNAKASTAKGALLAAVRGKNRSTVFEKAMRRAVPVEQFLALSEAAFSAANAFRKLASDFNSHAEYMAYLKRERRSKHRAPVNPSWDAFYGDRVVV